MTNPKRWVGRRLLMDEPDSPPSACCPMMANQLDHHCPQHPLPSQCPDVLVVCDEDGTFMLPIRDGNDASASSGVVIWHCPWCAAGLPGHRPHPKPGPAVTGKALNEEEAERRVDAWHDGADPMAELYEYLGWTEDEYQAWTVDGQVPTE